MGSGNFFAKLASVDPLAQALHLPGATKYAQQEANDANSKGAVGPYAGVTPTLAGANAGYAPGGPGANASYVPFKAQAPGGAFGFAQRFSSAVGDTTPSLGDGQLTPSNTPAQLGATFKTGAPTGTANAYATAPGVNPYVAASQKAVTQQPTNTGIWQQRGYS